MKSSGGCVSNEKNAFEQLLSEVEIPALRDHRPRTKLCNVCKHKAACCSRHPQMIWLYILPVHVHDVIPCETDPDCIAEKYSGSEPILDIRTGEVDDGQR